MGLLFFGCKNWRTQSCMPVSKFFPVFHFCYFFSCFFKNNGVHDWVWQKLCVRQFQSFLHVEILKLMYVNGFKKKTGVQYFLMQNEEIFSIFFLFQKMTIFL